MGRLTTLKREVNRLPERIAKPPQQRIERIRGRRLQQIRLEHWLETPFCAECGIGVGYPEGFELDHKQPLFKGGGDTKENRQVLCHDCHGEKTVSER